MSAIGTTPQQIVAQNFNEEIVEYNPRCLFYLAKRVDLCRVALLSTLAPPNVNVCSIRGLTPLHVAVITKNRLGVELFLRLGANVEIQDEEGWTPKHHAALLEDRALLDMLQGADNVTNKNGGTWKDLRKLAFPKNQEPSEDTTVFRYENDAGEIVEGTKGDFERLTGAKFAYQMFASPEFFNHQWANPPRRQPPSSDQGPTIGSLYHEPILNGYREFKKKPPTLYLKETPVGHGVFAKEEIPSGSIVLAYLGEALVEKNRPDYLMKKCDGMRVRNLGPMINDGLPNVAPFCLDNLAGLPSLHLFRSIKKISSGEQLLFSYGEDHPVKYEKYINFAGKEAVIRGYKDSSLKKRVRLLETFRGKGDAVGLMNEFQMLDYLLSSPLLQLELLLKEKLTIEVLNRTSEAIKHFKLEYKAFVDMSSRIAQETWRLCDLAPNPQLAKRGLACFLENLSAELPQHFAIECFDQIVSNYQRVSNTTKKKPPQELFGSEYLSIQIAPTVLWIIRRKFTLEKEGELITPEHALRRAAFKGDLFSVTFLIEKGFVKDPHSKAPRSGKTALDFARARNHLSVVQFLENR